MWEIDYRRTRRELKQSKSRTNNEWQNMCVHGWVGVCVQYDRLKAITESYILCIVDTITVASLYRIASQCRLKIDYN